jgi:hypothetical protein
VTDLHDRTRTGASRHAGHRRTPAGWPCGRGGGQAGRPAVGGAIEVRTAALDRDNAWTRLTGYVRHPYHRCGDATGLLAHTDDINWAADSPRNHPEVQQAPLADIDPAERARLELDYPRGATASAPRDQDPFGPALQLEVAGWARALAAPPARSMATRTR